MSNIIGSNAIVKSAQHARAESSAAARLASGKRINRASEDSAGLAAASKLDGIARAVGAATSNARRASTLAQIADSALSQIQQDVMRIKELAVASASDTFDNADRAKAQAEVASRLTSISNIVDTTRYGESVLLDGSAGKDGDGIFVFQVAEKDGDNASLDLSAKFDTATLGVDVVDISTFAGAQAALDLCDTAMGLLNDGRAKVGGFMAQMESSIVSGEEKGQNLKDAVSVFMDADVGEESTRFSESSIGKQLADAVISKSQAEREKVTALFRG